MKLKQYLYPSACLQCEEICEDLLCAECMGELTLIDPNLRCKRCFAPVDETKCRVSHSLYCWMGAAFDKEGPIAKLFTLARAHETHRLIRLFSSSLVIQLARLQWPMPDIVIPISRHRSLNMLLAEQFATDTQARYHKAFRKNRSGERIEASYFFSRRHGSKLTEKIVYLIDERVTNRDSLVRFAKEIAPFSPNKIFVLSLIV